MKNSCSVDRGRMKAKDDRGSERVERRATYRERGQREDMAFLCMSLETETAAQFPLAGMPPSLLPSFAIQCECGPAKPASVDCFLLFLSRLAPSLSFNEQVTLQKSVEQGTRCCPHHSKGRVARARSTRVYRRRRRRRRRSCLSSLRKNDLSVRSALEPHGCRVLLPPPSRRIQVDVLLEHHASCRSPGRHLHPHPHLRLRQPINCSRTFAGILRERRRYLQFQLAVIAIQAG